MSTLRDVSTLLDLLDRQPEPPPLLVVVTALVAVLLVVPERLWRLARNAITIAHEGGHALFAVLTGRRLQGVRLHSDTSGLTVSAGRPSGLGTVLTLLAGYLTPSLLGLGGAALLAADRIRLMLWISVVLLLAMLLLMRNAYGVLAVLLTGALVFAVSWYAPASAQAVFAYAGVWFLLLGGVKPVVELQRLRRRGRLPGSDADQLAGLTRIPALLWVFFFGLVNTAALLAGVLVLATPVLDI